MTMSTVAGRVCPLCQTAIAPGIEVVACNACGAAYHRACWDRAQHCATPGCAGQPYLAANPPLPTTAPPVASPPPGTPYVQPAPIVPPPPPVYPGYGQPSSVGARVGELSLEAGNTLIVPDGFVFPPLCLATGRSDDLVQRRRPESWAPTWVWITILAGLLVALIVYYCVRKTGNITISLTRDYLARKTAVLLANWGAFVVLFFGAFFFFNDSDTAGIGAIMIIASFIVPLVIAAIFLQNPYTVTKIDQGYLWLKFKQPDMAQAVYETYRQVGIG